MKLLLTYFRNGFVHGFGFLFSLFLIGATYAFVSNNVTSNTPLTSVMWNEMAGNYQYELNTEVNTGKKWINGKNIYRKVLSVTPTSNIDNILPVSSNTNINILYFNGRFINSDGAVYSINDTFSYATQQKNFYARIIGIANNIYVTFDDSRFFNLEQYVVVEYTY